MSLFASYLRLLSFVYFARMSLFGRDITVELAHLSGVSSPKDGSPQLDTALGETPDAQKGVTTKCMHFSIKTHIGWIPWKEREATLYSLFERAFAGIYRYNII